MQWRSCTVGLFDHGKGELRRKKKPMRFQLQRNKSVSVGAILISLVLLCGGGNPTLAAAPNPVRTGSGTGFFITEDGYLLTNHHVIDNAAQITVKRDAKEYVAKIVKVDKQNDLAVLKVEGKFAALPVISSRKVGLGHMVFTIGFPQVDVQGFSPKFTKGEISSLAGIQDNPRDFQISVPVQPGNSGGPLVDEFGNVVGVVVARLNAIRLLIEKRTLPQNVNYAVKSSFANSFIESLPKVVEKLKDPNPCNQPRILTDVIKEVQAATVLILVKSHKIHVLAAGDNYYGIAKKYGVSVRAIQEANPDVDARRLQIGQKLIVPASKPSPIPPSPIPNAPAPPAGNSITEPKPKTIGKK